MTIQRHQTVFLLILGFSLFGYMACTVNNNSASDPDYEIENSESELGQRITETDREIPVVSGSSTQTKQKFNRDFTLNMVAEIDVPVVNDAETQATMVNIFGNSARAVVSYNVKGDEHIGALDAIQVSSSARNAIRVRSGIKFSSAKANAAYIDENRVWVAHSSENGDLTGEDGFSAVRSFGLSGFNINDNPSHFGLPGFAANSVHESNDNLYVTSGSNAGLTILNNDLSDEIDFIDIPEARWVDTDDERIAVLAGSADSDSETGTLHLFNKSDRSQLAEYPFDGANTPEAKNTVELIGDLAIVAAGQYGTHLINLITGEIVATIPVPDAASLDLNPDEVESNAASADDEFIFIANGEAGVFVAKASQDLRSYSSGDELTVDLLGYLQFDEFQSANHVAFRNNILFVAAGLGGVKAVTLNR